MFYIKRFAAAAVWRVYLQRADFAKFVWIFRSCYSLCSIRRQELLPVEYIQCSHTQQYQRNISLVFVMRIQWSIVQNT